MKFDGPIRSKMEYFGDRLRQLIMEAHREGIVLSAPEPKDGFIELPPMEHQEVAIIYAPIPLTGFTHLNLKTPEGVSVRCVVNKNDKDEATDIVPSVKLPFPT